MHQHIDDLFDNKSGQSIREVVLYTSCDMEVTACWSPAVYRWRTGVRGPPRVSVVESAGRGGTESDSDTSRWTGMGVVSAKSA